MGLCDLYDYKLPKGTENWQGKARDGGRPPMVKMPTLLPTLTLTATKGQVIIRPGPDSHATGEKPWSLF